MDKGAVTVMASSGRKSRVARVIFVISALFLASLVIRAPAACARSWGEVVLHSFDETDGAYPIAGLIQASDGNFYGTTVAGDANNGGTVFQLAPSGTLTTLYKFCSKTDCTDGEYPSAGVIQGSDSNFYGTTESGGANRHGTVFQLTPSGTVTTLYSFCSLGGTACTDGKEPQAGVIEGSDGNFYGTTQLGGANGYGTVFQLTPSGTLTTLYSFCSQTDCTDGALPLAGLIQAINGNFYGTTVLGGANPNGVKPSPGTVFKLTPSGTLSTLYSFCSVGGTKCTDGKEPVAGLIQGTDGNFYGTTYEGGRNGRGTVFEITPSGRLTTLYSFCSKALCTDGRWPYAGLIQGIDDNFYGTTFGGGGTRRYGTVFRITPSGKLTTLYSFCSQPDCTDGKYPDASLIQSSEGYFYGTTSSGGARYYGTVFEAGASLPIGHIKVIPTKLTLKAEPSATASAGITIENTGTGQVTVSISPPRHNPPFSIESGGGSSIAIGVGNDHQVTIAYAPTSTTTSKEKSDSITVTAISGDPTQKKPITVKLKGED